MRLVAALSALALAAGPFACRPNTDLTVAPPDVDPVFEVSIPEPRADGRLPDWARPKRYRLSLTIDPSAERFVGEVVIDVELDRPTGALVLHADELTVERAEVITSAGATLSAETSYRKAAGAVDEQEELVVVTARELPAEEVRVRLVYSGPLQDKLRGIYRTVEDGKSYVFTQLEPSDARRVFPGFDDPKYKVPFDVEVTVPAGNLVLANSPELSRSSEGGRTRFRFATTKPLPTYLLALAVGPLQVVEGPGAPVPLRLAAAEGKAGVSALALETASAQLDLLGTWFARPYPYAKLDLVAVPNFGPGAMENAGLVTFREELLLVDPKNSAAKSRRNLAMIMAHELAHQWFGNLVTMKWWDDLWLNEGFATYMETLVVDELNPEMRAGLELLSLTGWVMDFDGLTSARRVRQPVAHTYEAQEAFDGITYIKGAAVIRMIHHWIGDEAFRAGLRRYFEQHAWGNATASDVFAALGATSERDVATVAASFLDQPGVPLVRAEVVCDAEGPPRLRLRQSRYRPQPRGTAEGLAWQIPVCAAYPTGKGRGAPIAQTCSVMREAEAELSLDEAGSCPAWLLPNAEHAGYYRYAMPAAQLEGLGGVMGGLDAATKVGFLTNLWALVQAGEVEAQLLVDTLRDFGGERDREVVEEMIALLGHMADGLVLPSARPAFEKLASSLLMPHVKRLGWEAGEDDSEDDRLLRRSVLGALAVHTSDPWLIREASRRAKRWLEDPEAVDADTAVIALRVAARHGAVDLDRLRAALEEHESDTAKRVIVVQALGSLGDQPELIQALNLLVGGTIRSQDAVYLARTASEWSDSRRSLVSWLGDNLATIAEEMPGFGLARMVAPLRRVCDPEAQREAERALTPVMAEIGGSDRRLREALEASSNCIDLRRRQAKQISDYLRERGRR